MFKEYSDVVSVSEMMTMLKIGRNSAYQLVKSGQIKSVRIGRCIKIPKSNIVKYLKSTH